MPIPLIIWAVGALLAGGAAGKAGEKYSDHIDEKAQRLRKETESYIARQQEVFEAKRRAYLERVISLASIIRAALVGTTPSLPLVTSELPEELRNTWIKILSGIQTMSSVSHDVISQQEKQQFWAGANRAVAMTRSYPNLGPATIVAAGAFYAAAGIGKAVNAQSYHDKVVSGCRKAKVAADASLSSLQSVRDQFDMLWDNTISPLLPMALGPPRNEMLCTALLSMVDEAVEEAQNILKENAG